MPPDRPWRHGRTAPDTGGAGDPAGGAGSRPAPRVRGPDDPRDRAAGRPGIPGKTMVDRFSGNTYFLNRKYR